MSACPTAASLRRRAAPPVPVGLVLLVLLPLLLMPLAAVFVFAFRGGPGGLRRRALALAGGAVRAALLACSIAFATAAVNAVLGTFTAYVLSTLPLPGRARRSASS